MTKNGAQGQIRRELKSILDSDIQKRLISTVIGPRQVGKTTLLQHLAAQLRSSGVPERNIVFLNFDDIELRTRLGENPVELAHEIEIRLGRPLASLKNRIYIFLDEAQKVPHVFDVVKLLFEEHGRRVKIFLSGSSSIEVQKRTAETLAGRIRYHYLFPLTLKELVLHHGLWDGEESPLELIVKGRATEEVLREIQASLWEKRDSIRSLRERMVLFGSLPGVYLEPSEEERWYILRDYAVTYIERDIRLLEGIGNLDLFHRLYRALLLQHGQILNLTNLAGDLGMSRNTVNSYLNVLEQTYVVHRLPTFAKRPKVRLMRAPKIYFFDSGIVNHGTRQTSPEALAASGREGAAEEGLVLSHLLAITREISAPPEIGYLRDYKGHEVDFFVEGKQLVGIEITTEGRMRKKRYLNIGYLSERVGLRKVIVIGKFRELTYETVGKVELTLLPSWMAW